ncbi:tetratricopeptide repeat protein [Geotalea sp. SG265]|uniref:tetratricopeptide repeat protein n=1 Tax=Geotalea sp. SG265 TaxID=2922867 RepID=UPI001FAF1D00
MNHAQDFYRQGNALAGAGDYAGAIAAYLQALQLAPRQPALLNNLGLAYMENGQLEEARATFERFIALDPENAEPWNNLAVVVQMAGDLEKAAELFRKAIALDPLYAEAWYNLGFALEEQRNWSDAMTCNRRAILLRHDYAEAHFNLALLLLLTGSFREGWQEYEWRWVTKGFSTPRRYFTQLQWDGSPFPGRTLLVHMEQGFGDIIQFIRYIPLVAGLGGKVVVAGPTELKGLLARVDGVERVLVDGDAWPEFHLHIPLMSLPLILGTELETIPGKVPYLQPEQEEVKEWARRLENDRAFKVGLVWSGRLNTEKNRRRACSLEDFGPLFTVAGISWYALQMGDGKEQLEAVPFGGQIRDLTYLIADFADTAALIANLDLVISIDTSVCHLAGALGKEVWTLLCRSADWRWLLDRNDSPWYPSMRLFRQDQAGDWSSVMARVEEALLERAVPKLKIYFYRSGIDYLLPPLLHAMKIPLLYDDPKGGQEVAAPRYDVLSIWQEDELGKPISPCRDSYDEVDSPADADFIVFPERIDELLENFGGEGAARFLRQLPHFATDEEKHVFLTVHDNSEPLGIKSVIFRTSASTFNADPATCVFPYRTEDFSAYLHYDLARIDYHTSFIGFIGSSPIRGPLMDSIIGEKRLVSYLDTCERFYGHLPVDELPRRRARFLEYMARSLTVLCPRGTGENTFRFFEAMSMGRIPVLVGDGCILPFASDIDYAAFMVRIPEQEVYRAGQLLYEWISQQSSTELLGRCRRARQAWEKYCRFSGINSMLLGMLQRHKKSWCQDERKKIQPDAYSPKVPRFDTEEISKCRM